MLSFDQALERVISAAPRLGTERTPLERALGRVLAEPLTSSAALPAFDYSAMDGYALSLATLQGTGPWRLPVSGESRTGHPLGRLETGTACRIFTGAAIPDGADAVIMQEQVERDADAICVAERPDRGEHIRKRGEDLTAGSVALPAGTLLGPYQLGLAAALDQHDLPVARRPKVVVLCTGDELRAPGSPSRPGTIPESNGIVIAGLVERAGGEAMREDLLGDDQKSTEQAIARALGEGDVLVTVGGVSVGDYDVVRPALYAAGAEIDFWKVAIKPGKPLVLGRANETVVLGLPGNPVSAQITFALFGLPLLRAMQGAERLRPVPERWRLGEPIHQKPGRRGFYRGRFQDGTVVALSSQASGAPTSMAWAEALIVVPEDVETAQRGRLVDVLRVAEL